MKTMATARCLAAIALAHVSQAEDGSWEIWEADPELGSRMTDCTE